MHMLDIPSGSAGRTYRTRKTTALKNLLRVAAVAACCFCAAAGSAVASTWPVKPITLVVGYNAGGSVDMVARIVGIELSKRLGQSVIIDNVGGAGGSIGAYKVVRAEADGYTLLVGSGSEVSIARLTNPAVRYDGEKDLAPITFVGTQPMVLIGRNGLAARNTEELIAIAKSQPGGVSYASSGIGTPLNLAGELIKQQGKVDILHVPYKGAGVIITDLIGGQIDLAVMGLSSTLSHIQSGSVQAYGVTEARRSNVLPNVPALAESATLKGVDMGLWFGLLAPVKTPRPVIDRLNTEMQAVLAMPEVKRKLADAGMEVAPPGNPAQFGAFIKRETARYQTIVKAAGIRE